ncbi:hypothetical protein J2W55_003354 [Mucilaginibacter pocheonensis]|uniref:Uncharacterized protein n=1 Tax=Mucilaginibacter pocheonensis TaxID=398050 RepID=A0ABU1TF58_9SPHI|nr:hypothetical protein [Mucilaginibacter pocheonensis]
MISLDDYNCTESEHPGVRFCSGFDQSACMSLFKTNHTHSRSYSITENGHQL